MLNHQCEQCSGSLHFELLQVSELPCQFTDETNYFLNICSHVIFNYSNKNYDYAKYHTYKYSMYMIFPHKYTTLLCQPQAMLAPQSFPTEICVFFLFYNDFLFISGSAQFITISSSWPLTFIYYYTLGIVLIVD